LNVSAHLIVLTSCYFANWAAKRYDNISRLTPEDIDPFLCTHINFAFAKVLESLTIAPYEEDDLKGWTANSKGMYERIMILKETNPDLRVLLSLGGWTHASRGFNEVSKSAANMYVSPCDQCQS
jgi:chitinase